MRRSECDKRTARGGLGFRFDFLLAGFLIFGRALTDLRWLVASISTLFNFVLSIITLSPYLSA
jgi:hypothetical protein